MHGAYEINAPRPYRLLWHKCATVLTRLSHDNGISMARLELRITSAESQGPQRCPSTYHPVTLPSTPQIYSSKNQRGFMDLFGGRFRKGKSATKEGSQSHRQPASPALIQTCSTKNLRCLHARHVPKAQTPELAQCRIGYFRRAGMKSCVAKFCLSRRWLKYIPSLRTGCV